MHENTRRAFALRLAPLGALCGLAGMAWAIAAPAAHAQASAPTSAQGIIEKLKPTGRVIGGGTRGIRPTRGPAPAAPSVSLTVDFASGSDAITPAAAATLDQLGQALASKDLAGDRFRIEGHTDTVGSTAFNQDLSQRRARQVAAYIEEKFKLDPSRLQTVGMGKQGLLVPTPDQTAEPRNRRVQIVNLGS
jgi:outer membrane protein OmpA-like peptidoglycan-associated protein